MLSSTILTNKTSLYGVKYYVFVGDALKCFLKRLIQMNDRRDIVPFRDGGNLRVWRFIGRPPKLNFILSVQFSTRL